MVRPTIVGINPVQLKYYPFMIILNKWIGNCNVLSPNICVPKETKDTNVKTFNRITSKDENEAMTESISCNFKCKFNKATYSSKQKWNNKTYQCEFKSYRKCNKDYSWNLSRYICENSKYFKSVADTSMIAFDENIIDMDIESTKKTKAIATNVSINSDDKNVYKIDCYILLTDLVAIKLLLIIAIIFYHHVKHIAVLLT